MSDFGSTAIQVSPKAPTEDEMRTVQSILQRAIDGLVGMSQLQHDVEQLTKTVADLQNNVDQYRRTIASQDETIVYLRGERERALDEARQWKDRATVAESERDTLKRACEDHAETIQRLRTDIDGVRRERDTAELKAMDLEDQLKAAQDKLNDIKSLAMDAFGLVPPPIPTVQSDPVTTADLSALSQAHDKPIEPEAEKVHWWDKPAITG